LQVSAFFISPTFLLVLLDGFIPVINLLIGEEYSSEKHILFSETYSCPFFFSCPPTSAISVNSNLGQQRVVRNPFILFLFKFISFQGGRFTLVWPS
jgi:hypothetical protein